MRIGFLQFGEPQHGVSRYGRLLAAAARLRPDLVVTESDLGAVPPRDLPAALAPAVARLGAVDLVHLQHNKQLIGEGRAASAVVSALLAAVRVPIVVNLHDVYFGDPWREFRKHGLTLRQRIDRLWLDWREGRSGRAALSRLIRRGAGVVCFTDEANRLADGLGAALTREHVRVIPHFVEPRTLPPRREARRALGVEGKRIVTLLGYIHRRKGHDLVVDALQHLPNDILVVFAGSAVGEHAKYLAELERKAERLGARERLRVTGYLEEPSLEQWLAATDLGLCPFRFFSASGSLATWIAAARPVLCHDLPQLSDFASIAADTFPTFDDYTPRALAAAILRELDRSDDRPSPGMQRLASEFSLERTVARHVELYRELLR